MSAAMTRSLRAPQPGGRAQRQRRQPAAPPGTGTFFSTVTTLLIPQGSAAPSMLLVVVVKATVAPDGTISNEVVQTYLVCRPRGAGRAP